MFCLSFILEFWTFDLDRFILIEIYFSEEYLQVNRSVLFVCFIICVCLLTVCPSLHVSLSLEVRVQHAFVYSFLLPIRYGG